MGLGLSIGRYSILDSDHDQEPKNLIGTSLIAKVKLYVHQTCANMQR